MPFTIFPAIDLRDGRVVRLKEGDPTQLTKYSDDPVETAQKWLDMGASWLHVINLDAAFDQPDQANDEAIRVISALAQKYQASVQLGGGLRSLDAIQRFMEIGIARVVLGTVAVENPDIAVSALHEWGSQCIAIGIDARDGLVKVRGWTAGTTLKALDLGQALALKGFQWLIYTDISRDGMQTGVNIHSTLEMAHETNMKVIASGGVRDQDEIEKLRDSGLAGVIVGKALYEGKLDLRTLLRQS